jgi:hypothetical protein
MLSVAQWRQTRIATKHGPVMLEAGELIIAERELAEEFSLHRNTIRSLIQRMVDEGIIALFSNRAPRLCGTVVRIQKYEAYQGERARPEVTQDQGGTEHETNPGPTQDLLGTKNKEDNEVKEVKKEVSEAPFRAPAERDPRGSRLPDGWVPNEEGRAYAVSVGLNPGKVAEEFRDYWHAKAGKEARKADWGLTWKSWCRRAAETGPKGRVPLRQKSSGLDLCTPPAFRGQEAPLWGGTTIDAEVEH